ncbi:MAG: xanthine dehydrogenase family protein subunit M [Acidobacteria bacterium]|nr:MAG: xanthine dehydrogenase family protein subunit M [Acidobacteriota bacterium]
MRLPIERYHRPESLAEACRLARELGDRARVLAGGTELLVRRKPGEPVPSDVISLARLDELRGIRVESGTLVIGALTTIRDVARSPLVREQFPVLAEAAALLGSEQIRSRATIGGNFCGAVPCADTPPPCLVGEASVRIAGPEGSREIPAEDLFTGPRQTALRQGEILAEIRIPPQPAGAGASFQRFGLRRGSAVAVASVAVRLVISSGTIAGARIALGAVAPTPLLARAAARELEGGRPGPEIFAKAARAAAEEARPICDVRGSAEFRRRLVEVLTRRALEEASARAVEAGR